MDPRNNENILEVSDIELEELEDELAENNIFNNNNNNIST